jgi:hypothetical protein
MTMVLPGPGNSVWLCRLLNILIIIFWEWEVVPNGTPSQNLSWCVRNVELIETY